MAYFFEKIKRKRDSLKMSAIIYGGLFVLSVLGGLYLFLPFNSVFSDTPPFFIHPKTSLNQSTPRFKSAFFYGTIDDPTGTISDFTDINDSLLIYNMDSERSITVHFAGKIQNKEGWFAFSENPVVLSAGESKQINFTINVPYGVCSKLWPAYIIASLSNYDGMPVSSGMGVSSSSAIEVFFNISGTPACGGSELLPGLGVSPAYVPLPTFTGKVPVISSGGGGGGGYVPPVSPVGPEICNNGIDDNGNGLIDCADPYCATSFYCVVGPEICNDGIDNDKNGLIDCADPACFGNAYCASLPKEICDNGIDDNGNGLIDCADPECRDFPACIDVPKEICDNGIDDNGNGLIDCADPECRDFPACVLSMFYITAYPEKRVEKAGGNYSTKGILTFYGSSGQKITFPVNTSASGFAQIENLSVADGFYAISFKGLSHLTKFLKNSDGSKRLVQILKNNDYTFDFRLFDPLFVLAGDIASSKDDYVNSFDISATTKVLYQAEENADLNADGVVNGLDLSILFNNLYKAGEI